MTGPRLQANEAQKNTEPVRQPRQVPDRQYEQGPVQAVAPQVAYRPSAEKRQRVDGGEFLVMQRTVGNHNVQRMLARRTDAANGRPPSALTRDPHALAFAHGSDFYFRRTGHRQRKS